MVLPRVLSLVLQGYSKNIIEIQKGISIAFPRVFPHEPSQAQPSTAKGTPRHTIGTPGNTMSTPWEHMSRPQGTATHGERNHGITTGTPEETMGMYAYYNVYPSHIS